LILEKLLAERNLPNVLANGWNEEIRQQALEFFTNNIYGKRPAAPTSMNFVELSESDYDLDDPDNSKEMRDYFAESSDVEFKRVRIICKLSPADYTGLKTLPENEHKFAFDVSCYLPKITETQKVPAIVVIDIRDSYDAKFLPMKDIAESGIAVFAFRYRHICNDFPEADTLPGGAREKFNNTGIDRLYYGKNLRDFGYDNRQPNDPGTIAFWSWGASRVMDYIETLDFVDLNKVAVSGHSRLGKTALFTGASDERFTYTFPNAACAGGTSLMRDGSTNIMREPFKKMPNTFPAWFCLNMQKFANTVPDKVDSHFLAACIAPRKLFVSNAWDDEYVHPYDEFLALVAASPIWEIFDVTGFVTEDRLPVAGDKFFNGNIGYHLRSGNHPMATEDWLAFLEFFINKKGE